MSPIAKRRRSGEGNDPIAKRRRSDPIAKKRRSDPIAKKRRSGEGNDPIAKRRQSGPIAKKRQSGEGNDPIAKRRRSGEGNNPIAKRPQSGEGNDFISSLPVHLIACILDFMPIDDAARTSILSKTWKNIWLSCSHVDLGRNFGHQLMVSKHSLISNAVDKILLAHPGPILKFRLFIPQSLDLRPHYNSWMSLLSTKGVEHLELLNLTKNPINSMPSHLFYFSKLLSLKLANYILDPPPDYRGFGNLTSVYLIHVRFDADMSFGPQLKELSLVRCVGIHHLGLQFTHHNKNLNKLTLWRPYLLEYFYAIFHHKDLVSSIKECIDMNSFLSSTPNMDTLILNRFCLGRMDPRRTRAMRPMENMKTLVLYNVDFYDMKLISNVLSLIGSSPNLEYLKIVVGGRQAMRENPEVERYLGTWWKTFVLNQLHTVEIGETERSRHGLLFIQLLYASSPSLKRLRWCPFTVGGISIEEFDRSSVTWGILQMF